MLLKGNKPTHKIPKVISPQDIIPPHSPNTLPPHRHALTAKSKSRHIVPNNNRTISIKPANSTSNFTPNLDSHKSTELISHEERSTNFGRITLNQFDKLQLQDFLKMAIVGAGEAPQVRSKEIIRSLNGTWFKNIQSSELPTHKLYNSLGIRRGIRSRSGTRSKFQEHHNPNDSFKRQYTPPNIFPQSKYSPRKNIISKMLIGMQENQMSKQDYDCPLKVKILRNSSAKQQKSSARKRPSSFFSQSKASRVGISQPKEGLVLGKRMILHYD